jgi:hypothetical protein
VLDLWEVETFGGHVGGHEDVLPAASEFLDGFRTFLLKTVWNLQFNIHIKLEENEKL